MGTVDARVCTVLNGPMNVLAAAAQPCPVDTATARMAPPATRAIRAWRRLVWLAFLAGEGRNVVLGMATS
jgi:hypothetical protein